MATDHLGLLSLPQLQNQPTLKPSSATGLWMWNPKLQKTQAQARVQDDNDSWEERAFEEDTNQAMGTTWPPRSYTCTFCMREFKSAQALGGHMNVHRRDRARLHHQVQPDTNNSPVLDGANFSTNIFTTQDVMENRGVRLIYMLPNPNPGGMNGDTSSHSSRLSMPQFQTNNLMPYFPTPTEFSVRSRSVDFSKGHCSNIEPPALINHTHQINNRSDTVEELDLELRLGRNSSLS